MINGQRMVISKIRYSIVCMRECPQVCAKIKFNILNVILEMEQMCPHYLHNFIEFFHIENFTEKEFSVLIWFNLGVYIFCTHYRANF